MHAVLVGPQMVHEGQRNALGGMTQSRRPSRFIREDDIEENGGKSHRIEANLKVDAHDVWHEQRRSLTDLIPELRRVREESGDDHFTSIITRFRLNGRGFGGVPSKDQNAADVPKIAEL